MCDDPVIPNMVVLFVNGTWVWTRLHYNEESFERKRNERDGAVMRETIAIHFSFTGASFSSQVTEAVIKLENVCVASTRI